jgi:molybdopterin synthase catalytic subunit
VAGFAEDQRQARTTSEGRFRVTLEPLDTGRTVAAVAAAGCGAVATFIGLVRDYNAGRRVLYLDYECYEPLAVKSFQRIATEAAERWPDVRLAIDHRVGPLQIGEASVVIAAASPHRAEAFAASRYAIERIKQIAPIWKREHFEGGDVWIEGATADPDNESARQQALTRAGT